MKYALNQKEKVSPKHFTLLKSSELRREKFTQKNLKSQNFQSESQKINQSRNVGKETYVTPFYKERCPQNFRKIYQKTPVSESLFFNKVADLRPETLL